MNNQPLVTIYTITRNRADLLPRAMKSILGQTYRNIEYLIIDSASTDNTEEVVHSFDDTRIRYIRLEENATFGTCVNMAFDLANGKYVSELDDDDEYCLEKIEKQVAVFETLPEDYGMVYCWMTYFDASNLQMIKTHKSDLRGFVYDDVVEKPTISGTPTLLVRKSIFSKIGGYKEAEEIGVESDFEFSVRVCKNYKVDFVPESLVNVYVNHGHIRMSDNGYYKDGLERSVKFSKYFLNEFRDAFEKHPERAAQHLYTCSKSLMLLGRYKEAMPFYRQYFKCCPSMKAIALIPYCLFKNLINR